MAYYITKFLVTAFIVVLVSEISKRSTVVGAIITSLPLISILAFTWLYVDTRDVECIAELANRILWLIIPSLLFFILLPVLIKLNLSFAVSMVLSIAVMLVGYVFMIYVLKIVT